MNDDLRLIEDYLPIQAISAEASREKAVRRGHISTLHLWWARRPLVACRAAVYGALVSASRFVPNGASDAKKKSLGRANAAKFVTRLCRYPSDSDKGRDVKLDTNKAIAEAQQHIFEAHAHRLSAELAEGRKTGHMPAWVKEFQFAGNRVAPADIADGRAPRPRVLDMFAGGGAIPLEALRLGCEAYALDLNPVAHIIQLCTLVYPQKYGKPDPTVRGMTGPNNANGETTWGSLADEVRYWGNWVLEKVRAEIGDLYPLILDPRAKEVELYPERQATMDFAKSEQLSLKVPAGHLTPIAYLWTRTVRCKNPSCAATVPLVKQTWLCKKEKRYVALKMVAPAGTKHVRFEVVESQTEAGLEFDPEAFSKGGNATCPFCGSVADTAYVKTEGQSGRLGHELMAVACSRAGEAGKVYLPATAVRVAPVGERIRALCEQEGITPPDEPLPLQGTLGFRVRAYGLTIWGDLFSDRQTFCLLSVATMVRRAGTAMGKMRQDEYHARAVLTYLSAMLDKLADFNSVQCTWNYTGGRGVGHSFTRQTVAMTWDFAETNPFNPAGASWVAICDDIPAAIEQLMLADTVAPKVQRGSAMQIPWADGCVDAVVTDPPYYDNVPYADISDFFYIWLRRSLGTVQSEHFALPHTPKKNEAIAEPTRHGGDVTQAKVAYEAMMGHAFSEASRVLKPGGPMVVVYAHKTTLGWSTLVDALRKAGFEVTEAWPMDTEMKARMRAMDSAALASSISLVARKRAHAAGVGNYEDDVQPDLQQIVRERVETLWEMGIAGADLVIAAVGAGLRAFTKYESVEYANGEEVPAEKFLAEVEGVVLDSMMDKLSGATGGNLSAVDSASRFYVLWRYVYKTAEIEAGEAIVFTYAQHVELDGAQGLSAGKDALVEKKKAKYRARDFSERGKNDKLGLPGEAGQQASLIDVLHRVLWLMDNSPRKLGDFLDEARPDRERLRVLAQALAGAALSGKSEADADKLVSTTAAEQAALGKLLANWRSLIESRIAAEDGTLFRKPGR